MTEQYINFEYNLSLKYPKDISSWVRDFEEEWVADRGAWDGSMWGNWEMYSEEAE